jgi:hypothetical protein
MKGIHTKEIASATGKSTRWVNKVKAHPQFQQKCTCFCEYERDKIISAHEQLNEKKPALMKNMLDLAFDADKESTKVQATQWCLERFPEYAPKNVPNIIQATQVSNLSQDDVNRNVAAASKLESVMNILREGNPHVLHIIKEQQDEPHNARQDTDTSG